MKGKTTYKNNFIHDYRGFIQELLQRHLSQNEYYSEVACFCFLFKKNFLEKNNPKHLENGSSKQTKPVKHLFHSKQISIIHYKVQHQNNISIHLELQKSNFNWHEHNLLTPQLITSQNVVTTTNHHNYQQKKKNTNVTQMFSTNWTISSCNNINHSCTSSFEAYKRKLYKSLAFIKTEIYFNELHK